MTRNSTLSRRQFLQRAASALGTIAAAPLFVPAAALGRSPVLAPGERIGLGFIGVGRQGTAHLLGAGAAGCVDRPDVQVVAVSDVWRDRRDGACQAVNERYAAADGRGRYSACHAYNDFRELLARPDIDAVVIAAPSHWHATMSVMAAAAGKDVYCETPTAVTIRESQAVVAAMRRYGRVYQAGTQQRSGYDGRFRLACELVRSGRIGKLEAVYAYGEGGGVAWPNRFGAAQPVPAGLDWELFLGPAPWFPYDGNTAPDRFTVGPLESAQHHYDLVQWAAGCDHSGPVEMLLDRGVPGFRYANGVTVHGRSYVGQPVGANGGACFVGTHGCIAVDRDQLVSNPPHLVRVPLRPEDVHLYRSPDQMTNFLECVRTRKQPISDAATAHRAISVALLAGLAKQINRGFKWDPQAEQCAEETEAARLLSVAQRAPWRT